MDHPKFLNGTTVLVATDRAGNALYCERNWRMGGKSYTLRTPAGQTRAWTRQGIGHQSAEKPPSGGRWTWLDAETREAYG